MSIRKKTHSERLISLKAYLSMLFFIAFMANAVAQSYSSIVYDRKLSKEFGASNLTTLHKSLYLFQDKHIPDTLTIENTFLRKSTGFGYRMAKLLLLEYPMDYYIEVTQHEIFGHGARYREFGYDDNSFNVKLPPPFGKGGGFAQRGILGSGYDRPTRQEEIAISIAGSEAGKVLASNVANQMLLDDKMHYRQAILYLYGENDLFFYLSGTKHNSSVREMNGNDMLSYVNRLNDIYSSTGKNYDIDKLYFQSLISLINPFQAYSLYTIFHTYGVKGQKYLKQIPMIKMGTVRYLPALNYSFTPLGSQYHFVNYVRYKKMLFTADFSLGEGTFNTFYGVSLKGFNLIDTEKVGLNLHLDVWNQPELELKEHTATSLMNKIGQSFKADLVFRPFNQQNKLGMFMQMGYKTKGYVRGEALDESFILRYGMSLRIN